MSEYPRAMYRDGGQMNIWGHDVDYRTVRGEDQENEALAQGWRLTPNKPHPLDHDGDGTPGGPKPRRGRPPKVRETVE